MYVDGIENEKSQNKKVSKDILNLGIIVKQLSQQAIISTAFLTGELKEPLTTHCWIHHTRDKIWRIKVFI